MTDSFCQLINSTDFIWHWIIDGIRGCVWCYWKFFAFILERWLVVVLFNAFKWTFGISTFIGAWCRFCDNFKSSVQISQAKMKTASLNRRNDALFCIHWCQRTYYFHFDIQRHTTFSAILDNSDWMNRSKDLFCVRA